MFNFEKLRNSSEANPLSVDLKNLREQSLSSDAVEKILARVEEKEDLSETAFDDAIEKCFEQMRALGMEPGSFAAYQQSKELLDDPREEGLSAYDDVKGTFNPKTRRIKISGLYATIAELLPEIYLEELVKNGFGERDIVLHHELIHSYQSDPEQKGIKDKIRQLFAVYTEGWHTHKLLKEVHAYVGSNRYRE